MEEQKIHSLIARCEVFFCENCYTENRITRHKEMWRNGILKFIAERKLTMYSPSIGDEYAQGCHHSGEVRPADRDLIRNVHVLDDMRKLGKIRKCCMTPIFYPFKRPTSTLKPTLKPSGRLLKKPTVERCQPPIPIESGNVTKTY